MTDILTPEQRRHCMQSIRGKDTKPEIKVRKVCHALGYRFRLHRRDLPGSPDLVFPRLRLCLFVHGCFWHRHPGCKFAYMPKSRMEFWQNKFEGNVERDNRTESNLRKLGWRVEIIWECETKDSAQLVERLSLILNKDQP